MFSLKFLVDTHTRLKDFNIDTISFDFILNCQESLHHSNLQRFAFPLKFKDYFLVLSSPELLLTFIKLVALAS